MRQDACVENMATLNCHTSEVAESIVELSWGRGCFVVYLLMYVALALSPTVVCFRTLYLSVMPLDARFFYRCFVGDDGIYSQLGGVRVGSVYHQFFRLRQEFCCAARTGALLLVYTGFFFCPFLCLRS